MDQPRTHKDLVLERVGLPRVERGIADRREAPFRCAERIKAEIATGPLGRNRFAMLPQ
jgi:hypothetical protein